MLLDTWLKQFLAEGDRSAVLYRGFFYSYEELHQRVQCFYTDLVEKGVSEGTVVRLGSEISPNRIALLLALLKRNCIVILSEDCVPRLNPELVVTVEFGVARYEHREHDVEHYRVDQLRVLNRPGVVIQQSGKLVIDDVAVMLNKIGKNESEVEKLTFDSLVDFKKLLIALNQKKSVIINNKFSSRIYSFQDYGLAA